MPPKAKSENHGKSQDKGKSRGAHKGWLVLAVGDDEVAMPGGKAVRLAQELCPNDEAPSVDEVRAQYPDPLSVGETANGEFVSLRSLVAGDDHDDDTGNERA